MKKSKVFISGKVTGMDYKLAEEHFNKAEESLSKFYEKVYNPTKLCDVSWGYWHCMIVCLLKLIPCRNVFVLNNWKNSRGARIEMKVSKLLRKHIIFEN